MANVILSEGTIQTRGRSISSGRLLQLFLFAHLLLVSFQIPFRAIVVDTTYVRDVLLILVVILWGLILLNPKKHRLIVRLTLLDRLFAFYLLLGMLITMFAIVQGVNSVQAITQFRNNFLPVTLYFVAKKAFSSYKGHVRLTNLFLFLTIVMILDVVLEFLLIRAGLSRHSIPWYHYTFQVSYRFIGNSGSAPGYILPEHSPVLGLLGWEHATAATIMILFAFSYPYFAENRLKNVFSGTLFLNAFRSRWFRQLLILLAVISIIILNVTMHIITLLLVLLVLPILSRPKLLVRNILILCVGIIVIFYATANFSDYFSIRGLNFAEVEFSSTSLGKIIESFQLINYIAGLPINLILFGDGNVLNSTLNAGYSSELRLLFFTITYGVIWLFLYLSIFFASLLCAWKIMKSRFVDSGMRLFATGTIGLLTVCLLDMGHYARGMYFPIIDIWAVCLGALSAIEVQRQQAKRLKAPCNRTNLN